MNDPIMTCYTSRGETSAKIRKSRRWYVRPVASAPCPECGVDCGRASPELVNHLRTRHPRRENEVEVS